MILYRIRGCAEIWKGCGKLAIAPQISTNFVEAKKKFKLLFKKYEKEEKEFSIALEKVITKHIKGPDLVELYTTEDPSVLTESVEIIHRRQNGERQSIDNNPD